MLLAEALQERADLNRRIMQIRERMNLNAMHQEGTEPGENPSELLKELDGCLYRLEALMLHINLTNTSTIVDGESLTALIARRDTLKLRVAAYQELLHSASQTTGRATRSEIRILPSISVKYIRRECDDLSQKLRLTDNAIQAANWKTELK